MMDNTGCHPTDVADKYSNIKVVYLPANTTSKLQPLDLGIIQNLKQHYRKLFMQYVLTKIEECDSASNVVKSVIVLQEVRWISEARKLVDSSVIKKCFQKAGILNKHFNVVKEFVLESDLFNDLDFSQAEVDPELLHLMQQTSGNDHCSHDCYVEDDIPTCFEMEDENWEDIFAELEPPSKQTRNGDDDDDDEGSGDENIQEDPSPPQLKIKSYTEALTALEDISSFLQSEGHVSEANKIMDC